MIETNIFLIENLPDLSCKYRLYEIRGLSSSSPNYEKNLNQLTQILSRKSRSPCIVTKWNDRMCVAQPSDANPLQNQVPLVGIQVQVIDLKTEHTLDFSKLNSNTAYIAKGFLQFYLKHPLKISPGLWNPNSGATVFQKNPDEHFRSLSRDVDMCKGFKFRIVVLPDYKIGICVDVARKYISRDTIPIRIGKNDFRKYKFKKCVYEYGNTWYEIRIEGIHDNKANQIIMPDGKSLYDNVAEKFGKYKSEHFTALPKDSDVLIYHTSDGAERHVPSGLCRMTFKTSYPSVKRIHHKTIMPPYKRKKEIEFIIENYFSGMKFQRKEIQVSHKPYEFEENTIKIPDLKFGSDVILSTDSSNDHHGTPLDEIGKEKSKLLLSSKAGFYVRKTLDPQYIIIPQSTYESYGKQLIEDIKQQVNRMYPQKDNKKYEPTIIPYNDSVQKTIPKIGNAIIKAVKLNFAFSGYGIVVIPRLPSSRYNKEDELANLVMRELRPRGIRVAVMHTDVPSRSYARIHNSGETTWQLTSDSRMASKFRGYLSNVVLNKILILNSCWPFVLSNPTHSDLVLGIDVKNQTAGFTFVFKDQTIVTQHDASEQREHLGTRQLESKIYKHIKDEQKRLLHPVKNVVIHRDGRLYQDELTGIKAAFKKLSEEGYVKEDYRITFTAISKTPMTPIRFFKTLTASGSQYETITNPQIGTYKIFDEYAFLCTTGYPYRYSGTAAPLQVTKVEGEMSWKEILEDIFNLSNLTWTRVDYCSKLPISIKMADITLREVAGAYDQDALNQEDEGDE